MLPMTQLRSVNTRFWADGFIVDCEPLEKIVFLYLLTNEATTLAGCYEISVRRIEFDTGVSRDIVETALDKFQAAGKIHFKDGWLVLSSFHRHQNLNANMGKSAAKVLISAPPWVRECVRQSLKSLGTIPEWFPNHSETIKGREEKGIEVEIEKEEKISTPQKAAMPRKPRDPRVDSAAIKAVLQVTAKYPVKDLWGPIIEIVGDEPDMQLLKDCWTKWISSGFSPKNYAWLFEWYASGEVPKNGNNKTHRGAYGSKRTDSDVLEQSAEFYKAFDD
jgi:hypothetical protein